MSVQMTNNACAATIGALDTVVTTVVVGPEGALFPQLQPGAGDWFYATISGAEGAGDENQLPEIVKVTAISGPDGSSQYTMTVERAANLNGYPAQSWEAGSNYQLLVTSELLYDLMLSSVDTAGATSWILNSTAVISQTARDVTVAENGYLLGVTTNGSADTVMQLPEIPQPDPNVAGGLEDIRYLIVNRTSNGTGTAVEIKAASGQTINQFISKSLTQRNSAMVLHAKRGNAYWDAVVTFDWDVIPDDGKVYGISYGPEYYEVIGSAPNDGRVYVRQGDNWVVGVEEAPIDGNEYVRKDGDWVLMPDIYTPTFVGAAVDLSAGQLTSTGSQNKINFDRVVFDPMATFDGAGTFTSPTPALYNVNVFINSQIYNQGSGMSMTWWVNGVAKRFFADTDSAKDNNDVATSGSFMALLDTGDTLHITYYVEDSGIRINAGGYFMVGLVMPVDPADIAAGTGMTMAQAVAAY